MLAEKLQFNLVAYYCAKHLLNDYRQLEGYKKGIYKKNAEGKEDNELLHDIIKEYSIEEFENDFPKMYDKIANKFYEIFRVSNSEDKKTFSSWMRLIDK